MTTSEKIQEYNEAKSICIQYKEFRGDKRSLGYRRLSNLVVDVYMGRMTNFGKQLGLPTFSEYFYSK